MIVAIAKCYVFRNITCYNFYTTVKYYSTGPNLLCDIYGACDQSCGWSGNESRPFLFVN